MGVERATTPCSGAAEEGRGDVGTEGWVEGVGGEEWGRGRGEGTGRR